MSQSFKPIDTNTWAMAQTFYYYTEMAPTTYTVDVDLEVTNLRKILKEKGIKFFPAYLYLVTKAITKLENFRVAKNEGVLGYWETLTPMYPQFHEESKSTSLLWTEYNEDFEVFYHNYLEDTRQYGNDRGIITSKGIPPKNSYIISCIPWFTFNSFSLHNHGIKDYFFPSFEAGAFKEVGGKVFMPLSVTVHHATVDGYHLKELFDALKEGFMQSETWLK